MRAVCTVAFGDRYYPLLGRLNDAIALHSPSVPFQCWGSLPDYCPSHAAKPYAFKPYLLMQAASGGATSLLWLDSVAVPIASMEPLWGRIERDGYLYSRRSWRDGAWTPLPYNNYQWTADSAYPALFPDFAIGRARELSRTIPQLSATILGFNLRHAAGREFLRQYYSLAHDTLAFAGPWANTNSPDAPYYAPTSGYLMGPCGPADVLGHRHDQTAASVIAWRLGLEPNDAAIDGVLEV